VSRYHTWLHQEIPDWLAQGLIQPAQAEALRTRYPLDARTGWGRLIFTGFGAVIFGLGVILLLAYNWEQLDRFTKLALVFGALASAHTGGMLRSRDGRPGVSAEGLHALGSMLFGAAIWLVAQIYHIEEHYPNAFLAWGLGTLVLAWALGSAIQGLMAVALVLTWQATELFDFSHSQQVAPWVILVGVFPLGWHLRSALLSAAATCALLVSLAFTTLELDEELAASAVFLISGAAVAWGRLIATSRDSALAVLGRAFSLPGHATYLFLLYLLSFPELTGELFDLNLSKPLDAAYFFTSLGLTALFWVALFSAPLLGRPAGWRATDLATLAGLICAALFSLIGFDHGGWATAIPFNLLLLAHSILLILDGARRVQLHRVVVGCLLLALLAAARYLDLFDSLLERALVFFLVGGSLLAVGSLYSRARKQQREAAS
jgi:hypothetical protein